MKKSDIKQILLAKKEPSSAFSPYVKLAEKHNIAFNFKPFVSTNHVSVSDFRRLKPIILSHTALIFTNKTGIDCFFQQIEQNTIPLKESMKYYCLTGILINYLQKYIVVKKRKIFNINGDLETFFTTFKKHQKEKFLIPSSNTAKKTITSFLKKNNIKYEKIIIYKIEPNDLSSIQPADYDLIAFYSPLDVHSFLKNFTNFTHTPTKIAAFGPDTSKAIKEAGLNCTINVPNQVSKSMADALDLYFQEKK